MILNQQRWNSCEKDTASQFWLSIQKKGVQVSKEMSFLQYQHLYLLLAQSAVSECVGVGGPSITGPEWLVSTLKVVCTVLSPVLWELCKLFLSDKFSEVVVIEEGCDIILGKVDPNVAKLLISGGPGALDVVTVDDATGIIEGVLWGEASGLTTLKI